VGFILGLASIAVTTIDGSAVVNTREDTTGTSITARRASAIGLAVQASHNRRLLGPLLTPSVAIFVSGGCITNAGRAPAARGYLVVATLTLVNSSDCRLTDVHTTDASARRAFANARFAVFAA